MEGGPFLDDDVQKEFGKYVEIVLHTDGGGDLYDSNQANRSFQLEQFGTVALPYYVLMDPSGKKIFWKGGGVYSAEEFRDFLRLAEAGDTDS